MTCNEKLKNFFTNKASGMSANHRQKKKKHANQNNIFDVYSHCNRRLFRRCCYVFSYRASARSYLCFKYSNIVVHVEY